MSGAHDSNRVHPTVGTDAPESAPSSGAGWLAATPSTSEAAMALAALGDASLGLGAPFAEPILIIGRARIAGTTNLRDIDDICEALEPGARLTLQRDSDNRDDAFAVRVLSPQGQPMGFVPADVNETVARLLDAGKRLYAIMTEHERYHAWNKVYFEVYLED